VHTLIRQIADPVREIEDLLFDRLPPQLFSPIALKLHEPENSKFYAGNLGFCSDCPSDKRPGFDCQKDNQYIFVTASRQKGNKNNASSHSLSQ